MTTGTMGNNTALLVAVLGSMMLILAPIGAEATYRRTANCPNSNEVSIVIGKHTICIPKDCGGKCVTNETCIPGFNYNCVCPYQLGVDASGKRTCSKQEPSCEDWCVEGETCKFNGRGRTECKCPHNQRTYTSKTERTCTADLPDTWYWLTTQGNTTGTHKSKQGYFRQHYQQSTGRSWFF